MPWRSSRSCSVTRLPAFHNKYLLLACCCCLQDIAKIFSAAPQLPRLAVKTAAAPGATADSISEDTEERELFSPETPASPTGGYGAVEQLVVSGDRVPKLYCVLISMHGLVRGEHMELGKDPDTGGQVRGSASICM